MIDNLSMYALLIGVVGIVATLLTYLGIVRQPAGNETMQGIAAEIHTGALAFLRREYTVLLPFLVIVAVLLGMAISTKTGIAFVIGGICSVAPGWVGMPGAPPSHLR